MARTLATKRSRMQRKRLLQRYQLLAARIADEIESWPEYEQSGDLYHLYNTVLHVASNVERAFEHEDVSKWTYS